jgi:hypothetical protein
VAMDVLLRRDSCQSAGRSLRVPRALSRAAGLIAAVRETSWAMPQRVTGRLEGFQTYNDAWQGLPGAAAEAASIHAPTVAAGR